MDNKCVRRIWSEYGSKISILIFWTLWLVSFIFVLIHEWHPDEPHLPTPSRIAGHATRVGGAVYAMREGDYISSRFEGTESGVVHAIQYSAPFGMVYLGVGMEGVRIRSIPKGVIVKFAMIDTVLYHGDIWP